MAEKDQMVTKRHVFTAMGSQAMRITLQSLIPGVNYRNHWFWIDDRDFKSKRTFAFLMILFSLTETGNQEGLPLVTIPSG